MQMTEDELMTIVGRLYVGTILRDRELARLRTLVSEYEVIARDPDARAVEDSDGVVPAQD